MERRKREGKRLNGEVQGEGVILAAGKEKGNERKGRQTCMRVSSSSQKAEKRVTGDKGGGRGAVECARSLTEKEQRPEQEEW